MQQNKAEKADLVTGLVTESLPNTTFRVKLDGEEDKEVLAYLSGRMRLNRIRILIGDRVELVIDSYGNRARVVKRL